MAYGRWWKNNQPWYVSHDIRGSCVVLGREQRDQSKHRRNGRKLGAADSIANESIFTILCARRDPRGLEQL